MATWPTGGQAGDLADDRRKAFEPQELPQSAQPQECRQRCDDDEQCTAWWFEPVGSNFRTQPVCFRWDGATALSPPQPGPEGSAMGIKAGVRQIALEDGESCVDAAPEKTQAIRFNEDDARCLAQRVDDLRGRGGGRIACHRGRPRSGGHPYRHVQRQPQSQCRRRVAP